MVQFTRRIYTNMDLLLISLSQGVHLHAGGWDLPGIGVLTSLFSCLFGFLHLYHYHFSSDYRDKITSPWFPSSLKRKEQGLERGFSS